MWVIVWATIPNLLLLFLEVAWAGRHRGDPNIVGYARNDTVASLSMGVGHALLANVSRLWGVAAWTVVGMTWLYGHAAWRLPNVWWTWVLLLFAEDLCYYVFHRASHEVRFLWAAHVNHHSSVHYNLSTALRGSWTSPFTGPLFWLLLPLLGFAPWMIVTQQAVSLVYQYWTHTEAIVRLPRPIELVFNTPSHHRVHHGVNSQYLDRNYGGILIIWDRLFGTFAPERERPIYGLTENIHSYRPHVIAFHEWRAMWRDVTRAPTWRAAVRHLVGSPWGRR